MTPNDSPRPGGYINFIAYLQIIGIILVVAGHSLHEYPDGAHGWSTPFYRSIMTVSLPLFMFVSGLLMVYTSGLTRTPKYTPRSFVRNKLRRLILPFIVLTTVTFVPRALFDSMSDDPFPLTLDNFGRSLVYQDCMPIPFFWFLQVSFIMLSLTFCVLYFCGSRRVRPAAAVLGLLFLAFLVAPIEVTPFLSIDRVRDFGFFFIAGCLYSLYSARIDRLIPWTDIRFLSASAAAWIGLFLLFEDSPLRFLCSLTGIAMCMSLARIMEERRWQFLDHLKAANYMIFLLSWYFNIAAQQVLAHFVALPWWVHTSLSLIAGIYIPWLGYKYLEKHQDNRLIRITSYILGQSFRKRA